MTLKTLENKINKIQRELDNLKKEQLKLKIHQTRRINEENKDRKKKWEELSEKISKKWIGNPNSIEAVNYEREKNGL